MLDDVQVHIFLGKCAWGFSDLGVSAILAGCLEALEQLGPHLRILATSVTLALSLLLAVLGFSSLSSCTSVVLILEEEGQGGSSEW